MDLGSLNFKTWRVLRKLPTLKKDSFLLANKFEEKYALLKNDQVFEMLAKETNNGSKIV